MSLLTMCTDAARELGLPVPTGVVSSADPLTLMLLRVANEEGKSLASRADWQNLTSEHTFTTVAADAQTSSIPSDFDHIVSDTMFNRTTTRKVYGPISESDWQRYKASLTSYVNPAFRIRGGSILMAPTQTAGQTVAYEYISNKWCQSAAGTALSAFASDSDTAKLDEELIRLGMVWRFRKAKGLEYTGQRDDYERRLLDFILRDGAKARLDASCSVSDYTPRAPQVPDTLVF